MCKLNPNSIFLNQLNYIKQNGEECQTRNSKTVRSIGLQSRFETTPLITIRRTAWKNALREMEWFLSGSDCIYDLHKSVRHWWEPWADTRGIIHNNYSTQFKSFAGCDSKRQLIMVDQIKYMIDALKNHPKSRRNVATTWNAAEMTDKSTPITNCHGSIIQNFVSNDNKVHMIMYQRSADMMLGVPHNFIQYWALLLYLSYRAERDPGSFTWIGGDCHIYENHFDMLKKLNDLENIEDLPIPELIYIPTSVEFKASDFTLSQQYIPAICESIPMTV